MRGCVTYSIVLQELIRRWDSEREPFYYDIVQLEAISIIATVREREFMFAKINHKPHEKVTGMFVSRTPPNIVTIAAHFRIYVHCIGSITPDDCNFRDDNESDNDILDHSLEWLFNSHV